MQLNNTSALFHYVTTLAANKNIINTFLKILEQTYFQCYTDAFVYFSVNRQSNCNI